MAVEFGITRGTPHHNYAVLLDTDPDATTYAAIELDNTVPHGTMVVFVDAHITSVSTDDELCLADSATPDHCHRLKTSVANKQASQSMMAMLDADRKLWWKVSNARVTNVELDMYYSFR